MRRYLHRFIQEFPRLNTLSGVDRTPFNQYDSIILPITTYLNKCGVDFQYNTSVTHVHFTTSDAHTVQSITTYRHGQAGPYIVDIKPTDVLLVTLGSMTAESNSGTNTTPPGPPPEQLSPSVSDCFKLWRSIANNHPKFGNPSNFDMRVSESTWESFTVTITDEFDTFFQVLEDFTGNKAGTGALTTLVNSNWLMSIVVPHQPHFAKQPDTVKVFWGYGLSPWREGNYITKPMIECTGEEIMTELLMHFRFPVEPILRTASCIPCVMPYITSQFLTRHSTKDNIRPDRPQVVPHGSTNLAFLGQYVEIKDDVVFTVEYSVRGAQMAVAEMMGLPPLTEKMYKGDHHINVLRDGLKTLLK